MNWRRLGVSVGFLVLTNAVVLAGVAYNRSGEPDVEITLTEREVPVSLGTGGPNDEDTGLALHLRWQSPNMRWHSFQHESGPAWFDQAKLEAVGYDCSLPLSDLDAALYYNRQLPREVYVVLEYEGQAWADWLKAWGEDLLSASAKVAAGQLSQQNVDKHREGYERVSITAARLVAIDVGKDAVQLRQQYPEPHRFIITRAQVRLAFKEGKTESGEDYPPHLRGSVTHVLTEEIHVPYEWHSVLTRFTEGRSSYKNFQNSFAWQGDPKEPRYEITLRYGKRHEPWITAVRLLPAAS
ncbi:MAG: DUF4824 family protein [Nitrospira sp.]|nr:DUF4824 family protein [Nitrospira sp.]